MKIEFVGEKTIDIQPGETVLDASLKAGIPHFHACGGNGKCSTCRILVLEGLENLSPISRKEAVLRKNIPFPAKVRLACQATVERMPVKIERILKDEMDFALFPDTNDPRAGNSQLGEEKELVLFFLDIRNFTPFIETYLPFDVIHIMRRLFFVFHKIIQNHNGEIIETAGDEFYAVFGLKSGSRQAADDAIQATETISRELEEMNAAYLKKYFNITFEAGMGLHFGKVIVGNIKLGKKHNTSVMGLAVNVASRLQSSTREVNNSIIVSDALLRHSSYTNKTTTKEIHLKGIQDSLLVHLLGKPFNKT